MTKEEAIKSFEEDNRTMLENKTAYINELKARGMEFEDRMVSYIDESVERNELAISALKGEWVDDRAPEDRKEVLVYDNAGDMFVAWFEDNEWQSTDLLYTNDVPILAWQPLPESYKKGE